MSNSFDEYAKNYNAILSNQLQFFDAENDYFAEYKVRLLKDYLQHTPGTILDFGCGVGRGTVFLKKYFPNTAVFGCDISEKSLEQARAVSDTIHFFNTQELQTLNIPFDVIFVAGVFHHIPPSERQSIFKTLISTTKPGAQLIVFEHNPFNPITRHLVNTCPFDEDAVLLKPKELRHLFQQANMKQIQCHYTLFFPACLKYFRPLEKYLKFLPLGGQYLVSGMV